mmetsp:Transcript_78659/g.138728  ORF Transcript_78659/g.138728 Transcript_78659/m.138728 type:complete len:457 (+) Transcript_78659:73-1443(+)
MLSAKLVLVTALLVRVAAGSCDVAGSDSCKAESNARSHSLLQTKIASQADHGTQREKILLWTWKLSAALTDFAGKVVSSAKPGYVEVPIWAFVCLLVLLVALTFFGINGLLLSRTKRAHRLHNIEDAHDHQHHHGSFLGTLVEHAVEHFDKEMVGVNIDFGVLNVKATQGIVEIVDLTIENPDDYWSDYCIHVGHCLVDLDMEAYVLSFGKNIVIERLHFQDVEVVWERGWFTSNFNDIMSFFRQHYKKESQEQAPKASAQAEASSQAQGARPTEVGEVVMNNISLKLAFHKLGGCGPQLVANDIYFENFSKAKSSEMKESTDVVPLLTKTLITSLLASLIGEESAHAIFQDSSTILQSVVGSFWHLLMGLWICIAAMFGIKAETNDTTAHPFLLKEKRRSFTRTAQSSANSLRMTVAEVAGDFKSKFFRSREDQPAEQPSQQQQVTCVPLSCSLM